ncbi:MAG TPA: asparagine synthase-related protein [Candidatus Binatia bacterium]|nr:asparagine synthase-related protein [Candidatus Binatia bacterium]
MGICGIAASPASRPIQRLELQAMCAGFSPAARDVALVAQTFAAGCNTGTLWSSDTVAVACDADLYNSDQPAGLSACQWIAGLYDRHGSSFVEKLRGAFALAVWDKAHRRLLLAVDRFGMKRLCYASDGSALLFASQPSQILAAGRMQKKVNLSAITDYFVYNVVPAPQTAFAGVTRIAPGELILWNDGKATTKRYWDMRYPEDARGTESSLADELLFRMENAVRATSKGLDFDKTGCFLSGGTDSSSILGFASRLHNDPVRAFSIGFSEDRFNELDYARLAARRFQATHIEGKLGAGDMKQVIDRIVAAYDEPFANSSAVPTYWCAKLAREHGMEVLLAGDGGDELFGGNERYREEQIFNSYKTIPAFLRRWVIEPTAIGKVKNYVTRAKAGNPERYCRWRLLQRYSPELVLQPHMPFRNGHSDLLATMRMHFTNAPTSSDLNRLLYVDVKMTLGDDDLPKVTRTAEIAGIRVRFPYLDHELAEFTGTLPADMKVRFLEKRYLFKRATRNLLPHEILRKKKHGFGLPIGLWLKSDPELHGWAKEVLGDPRTYQRGYFRKEFVDQLFTSMQQDNTPYFGDLLWVFLSLELWHRRHVEGVSC